MENWRWSQGPPSIYCISAFFFIVQLLWIFCRTQAEFTCLRVETNSGSLPLGCIFAAFLLLLLKDLFAGWLFLFILWWTGPRWISKKLLFLLSLNWTACACGMWEFHWKKRGSEVAVNFLQQQLLKTGVATTPNFITGLVVRGFRDGTSLPSANILNQMGGGWVCCIKGNGENQIKRILLLSLGWNGRRKRKKKSLKQPLLLFWHHWDEPTGLNKGIWKINFFGVEDNFCCLLVAQCSWSEPLVMLLGFNCLQWE